MEIKNLGWAAIVCLWLLPATAGGHELNFDGKTIVGLREWCFGDLTGAGRVVDAEDVTELVEQFGATCPEDCEDPDCPDECDFDLNHNHVVGEGDLRVLLGNWGPCRDRADVNGDGDVDLDDAIAVADDYGSYCFPDLDWNGLVQGNDLNLAQLAWGPGDDHQGDVNRNGVLEIGSDLLAVIESLGRVCTGDFNYDGTVGCEDLDSVCTIADVECCTIPAVADLVPSCCF